MIGLRYSSQSYLFTSKAFSLYFISAINITKSPTKDLMK